MAEKKSESYRIDINTMLIALLLSCLLCNTAVFIKSSFANVFIFFLQIRELDV